MIIKSIVFGVSILATAIMMPLLYTSSVQALSSADWSAGYIVDDTTFTNKNDMSIAEIQTFLNQGVGTGTYGRVAGQCDTNGIAQSELGGGTRAQYGAANGTPAPFTCLKDYYEVPKTSPGLGMPANNYGGLPIPTGAKSAAELIWNAAQKYNINPKVLLVKLHTESAGPLTTDDWPVLAQYRYAMGAHCPDSGPNGSANCDPNYAGFSIQISEAAALMRYYLDNMDQSWWPYAKPNTTNNILWNVAATGCGASNVYIETHATAALYTYTPYQPNQAALNNLSGIGDGCSAYGNRNFWRVFNNWFGPTNGYIIRTSEDGKMYMRGQGNTYYYITSSDQLKNIGYGSTVNRVLNTTINYLSSMTSAGDLPNLVRFGNGSEVYLIDSGNRYYISYTAYQSFGSPAVGNLLGTYYNSLYDAPTLTSVVRQYGDSNLYAVQSGKRHYIGGPTVYNSGGFNSQPITSLSSFTIQNLPIGAPLLQAGTLIESSDTQQYGIIKTDIQTQQPISNTVAKSLTVPIYTDTSLALNQLTINGSTATFLVKDSLNDLYMIDGNSKYSVSASQLQSLGKTANDFVLVDNPFLSSLITRVSNSQSLLVRVAWTGTVYNVINSELFSVSSLQDFNALGYNFNNVLDISKNTLDNLFINYGRSMVTNGSLFRVNTDPTIYLMGYDSKTHVVQGGDVFNDFGFQYSDVTSINSQTFQNLTTGNLLQNFFSAPDGSEWGASNGSRYWISPSLSTQYRSSIDLYTDLMSKNINLMGIGKNLTRFIRINASKNVYYITGSTKELLNSPSAFANNGGTDWSQVISVSQAFANNLTDGPVLN